MAVRLSALRASQALLPRNIIILMFLVLTSVRGRVNPRATVQLEGFGKLKELNDIGTRTRDLLDCSVAPQACKLLYDCFPEDTTYGILVREMVYANYLALIRTVRIVIRNITILGFGGPCEVILFLEP
jgi:hypothetical protein